MLLNDAQIFYVPEGTDERGGKTNWIAFELPKILWYHIFNCSVEIEGNVLQKSANYMSVQSKNA